MCLMLAKLPLSCGRTLCVCCCFPLLSPAPCSTTVVTFLTALTVVHFTCSSCLSLLYWFATGLPTVECLSTMRNKRSQPRFHGNASNGAPRRSLTCPPCPLPFPYAQDTRHLYLLMDYCAGGDLASLIRCESPSTCRTSIDRTGGGGGGTRGEKGRFCF